MRLLVVCWVLLSAPTLRAQATSVRLITESVALEPAWQLAWPISELSLTAPCLACRLPMFSSEPAALSALPSARIVGASSPRVVARSTTTRSASPRARPLALGDSWRLGGGRELSIHLTPTQEECAPLMRLRF